jgi:hypothetical protein
VQACDTQRARCGVQGASRACTADSLAARCAGAAHAASARGAGLFASPSPCQIV